MVLSGTGRDGAAGVLAIKKYGGTVLTQDEASAEFFGMPEAALLTGVVDQVLRTGHAYSPESLLAKQSDVLEVAFWAALRSLEENAALARRMEKRTRDHGNLRASESYKRRGEDAEKHAAAIHAILEKGGSDLE